MCGCFTSTYKPSEFLQVHFNMDGEYGFSAIIMWLRAIMCWSSPQCICNGGDLGELSLSKRYYDGVCYYD